MVQRVERETGRQKGTVGGGEGKGEGERFYVYSPWRIPIAGGVQEEKAGGEVAKRVKSSGARNR